MNRPIQQLIFCALLCTAQTYAQESKHAPVLSEDLFAFFESDCDAQSDKSYEDDAFFSDIEEQKKPSSIAFLATQLGTRVICTYIACKTLARTWGTWGYECINKAYARFLHMIYMS